MPSEYIVALVESKPSAELFVFLLGSTVLFLFSVASAIIATAEIYSATRSDSMVHYRMTFVVLVFFIKIMVGKLIKRNFEMNSPLYQEMPRHIQEKACAALESFVWAFYFVPIVTHFAYIVFAMIREPRLMFFEKYAGYVVNVLFAGLIDQVHDLAVRHPDIFLYGHHIFGMFATMLLLDGLPLSQKCSGALLLGIQSGFDKVMFCVLTLSYFLKQRSLTESGTPLSGVDVLLPSEATLRCWFRIAFYYYVVGVRAAVSTAVLVYCCLKWDDMPLVWQVLLPITVFFFFIVDVPTYTLLWRRSVA